MPVNWPFSVRPASAPTPAPKPSPIVPQTHAVAVPPPVVAPVQTQSPPPLPIEREVPSPTVTSTNVPPAFEDTDFPRTIRDTVELQIALARQAISPGSVDGVMGSQTRAALLAFQRREGLPETAALDNATRARLSLSSPPFIQRVVVSNDLARLQPLSNTWLGKSQQTALEYETLLELLAEEGRASPNLVRRLNPGLDWTNATIGTVVRIPLATNSPPARKAAFVVISLGEKRLQAFDAQTNLLAHFPCSIAARVEKRPAGELQVVAIAENPNYTFNPEVFPESPEARKLNRKLILPPGPNNPVGTAWISLSRSGYGIHGTPGPEQVGRTESHGCFRLANWNAEHLIKLVWVGMPVYVTP